MDADKLEELERLLKAGTPGPWFYKDSEVFAGLPPCGTPVAFAEEDGLEVANAALIVAAINALPELVAMGRDYAKLNEPDGVLINMMRGTIPKVSANSLHKLYTEDELINAARNVFSARIADHDAALKGPTT